MPGLADQFRQWGFQALFLQGTKSVNPCNTICSVFSWALVFNDADSAHRALAALEIAQPLLYQNVKKLPATGLGDEGYGLQGRVSATGQEAILYVWRAHNAILYGYYNVQPGTVNPNDVLATAIKMQAHTK